MAQFFVLHAVFVLVGLPPALVYLFLHFVKKGVLIWLLYVGAGILLRDRLTGWICPSCSRSFMGGQDNSVISS